MQGGGFPGETCLGVSSQLTNDHLGVENKYDNSPQERKSTRKSQTLRTESQRDPHIVAKVFVQAGTLGEILPDVILAGPRS